MTELIFRNPDFPSGHMDVLALCLPLLCIQTEQLPRVWMGPSCSLAMLDRRSLELLVSLNELAHRYSTKRTKVPLNLPFCFPQMKHWLTTTRFFLAEVLQLGGVPPSLARLARLAMFVSIHRYLTEINLSTRLLPSNWALTRFRLVWVLSSSLLPRHSSTYLNCTPKASQSTVRML